ncbi:MAG TPA: hypothetical protein VHA75_09480 [Rugosimonospora sp.]|nr:hypothetical protein [Rugosimonospora sp.]
MTEELPARRQFPPRDPVPDDDPRYDHLARCGHWKGKNGDWHRRSDGSRCLGWVRKGTTTCDSHSGTDRETAGARSAIATTIRGALTYDGPVIDSGEIMLNASSAAWHRATTLTAELDRLYGEAGEVVVPGIVVGDGISRRELPPGWEFFGHASIAFCAGPMIPPITAWSIRTRP